MPERLTPVDILNLRFRRRLTGYAIGEVDDFVRRSAAAMEAVLSESADLRERLNTQEKELSQYRALETTMRDALILAQKTADETRYAARAQADAILQDAQARSAEVQNQIEALKQERRRIVRDLRAQFSAQLAWLSEEVQDDAPLTAQKGNREQGTGNSKSPMPVFPVGTSSEPLSLVSFNGVGTDACDEVESF